MQLSELRNDERNPSIDFDQSKSQQGRKKVLSHESLFEMMKDPRYSGHAMQRDPDYIQIITDGFKELAEIGETNRLQDEAESLRTKDEQARKQKSGQKSGILDI